MAGRVPVLWITGPAGVGKSAVSWQLFTELASSGTRAGLADADQLCMCYPPPPDDPSRDCIRACNAGVVIRNYQAAGARRVILNGVINPVLGVLPDLLGPAELMVCRLRAEPEEVARRLAGRRPASSSGQGDALDALRLVREDCSRMDASRFADVCVDTTGVPAAVVARLVRDSCRDWRGFRDAVGQQECAAPASPGGAAEDGAHATGRVLLLCGPTGVGKSTIGFQLYLRSLRAGLTAGYIDLDQIGFLTPTSDDDPHRHRVKARNLAAIWRNYQAEGATHLVVTGPVESQAALQIYLAALPGAVVTACRLHAGPAELARRILTRADGGSWPQPGDPLRGQSARYLSKAAEQAAAEALALDRSSLEARRVDTDGRTADQAADVVAAAAGWPDA